MKKEVYTYPKSGFLNMEKDLSVITNLILNNNNLKKLLYYTTKDCLFQEDLTFEQSLELFDKNVKIVPKLKVNKEVLNYLFISFNNFGTNIFNPEFRDSELEIDIICHFDQWQLKDFKLRPYRIAAEIDSMLSNKRLSGLGELQLLSGVKININNEFGGLCLTYRIINGEEDKVVPLVPEEKELLDDNFDLLFNTEEE